jgi:thioredoxin reductase (NADPH)
VSGRELAQRAYEQAWLFGTEFAYANAVTGLRAEDGRRIVTLADGAEASALAVVLATGVSYRRLGIESLERLVGAGVYYGAAVTEAEAVRGLPVGVVGGGNSAGQAAVHLSGFAAHVTLLVRGSTLAESMSEYLIEQLDAAPNIDVRFGTELVEGAGAAALERVTVRDRATGSTQELEAAALFVLIGAEPRTSWLPPDVERDAWGFVMTGDDVTLGADARTPSPLETSLPGVFAVGDVRHRSVKRVASAVGEGSIAIRHVHGYLDALDA